MVSGLLVLLDDIAKILDDVATMTKVAVKKSEATLRVCVFCEGDMCFEAGIPREV